MILFMFDHYTLSSVWVAEWPPFEKIGHLFSLSTRHVSCLFE